jgi:hypothetical protein
MGGERFSFGVRIAADAAAKERKVSEGRLGQDFLI